MSQAKSKKTASETTIKKTTVKKTTAKKTTAKKTAVKKTTAKKRVAKKETVSIAQTGDGLNPRQRLFVEHYCRSLNATQAARKAGYTGEYFTLANIGYQNLKKVEIANAISQRLSKTVMGPDELSARLAKIARGSFSPFLHSDPDRVKGEAPKIDLGSEAAEEHVDLIRDLKTKTFTKISSEGDGGEESATEIVEIDVKLHDPMRAMEILAKLHGNAEPPPPAAQPVVVNVGNDAVGVLGQLLGVNPEKLPADLKEKAQEQEQKQEETQENE